MTKQLIVMVVVCVAACGKKTGDKAKPAPAGGGGSVDVAPANAAIPAAWKGKLEFVAQTITNHDDAVTVPAPKGWKVGFLKDTLVPGDADDMGKSPVFGFATVFRAGKSCGGECKAKPAAEWEAAANTSSFANMLAHTPPPKIIKDDKQPGRRVMIAQDQNTDGNQNKTVVLTAFWKDGAERFYYCNADLAEESKDLAPAFEQACAKLAADF